jgi:pyridoxal phosphate enzyme (YggS family)
MDLSAQVAANLESVRHRIANAARQAQRDPATITLVGVTKYVPLEYTCALATAGCADLGESRPQALWEKGKQLETWPLRWHMIGHMQRNKVKRTLPYVSLLHSGDSLRLLEEVNEEAAQLGRAVNVLLEVNVSQDATKHGFACDEIARLLPQIAGLAHLRVLGLMTMAALEGGPERARRDFAALRQLRDRLRNDCPPEIGLDQLSMGMSGDFEEAILEGATLVRVGSALWEGIAA